MHNHLGAPGKMFPDEARTFSKSQRRQMAGWWDFTIAAFKAVMGVGLVLGLALFLRPSVSMAEKRQLTQFPTFTMATFLDGTYTKDISTWYADTFPFRDQLMTANHTMTSLYGIKMNTQLIGTQQKADEIPDAGRKAEKTTEDTGPAALPEDYTAEQLEANIQGQIMNGAYVKDGAVYGRYYFTQDAAQAYAEAVDKAAADLAGQTTVYSVLIPNNSGVMLSEDELQMLGGSDQAAAIKYYYSLYDDSVVTVPTFDTLRAHNSEYLYFKTDHHWTALGAYYVYRSFCEVKGIEPHELDQFVEEDFPNFQGSYYDTLVEAGMANSSDTLQAWVPNGTNDMTWWDEYGNENQWNIIADVSGWASDSKYMAFVAGDRPLAHMHNPQITDGSSVMVVKESYGNAFIPWLVDHYEDVYYADFRYTTVNVADYCKQHDIQDLIIFNNITIGGSVQVANKIESLM